LETISFVQVAKNVGYCKTLRFQVKSQGLQFERNQRYTENFFNKKQPFDIIDLQEIVETIKQVSRKIANFLISQDEHCCISARIRT
jgi:hypothetical protein